MSSGDGVLRLVEQGSDHKGKKVSMETLCLVTTKSTVTLKESVEY